MTKVKWNYAVIKSIFGDLWVGKTKLKADEDSIFSDKEDAINLAEQLFEDNHFDFDSSLTEDDEYYDDDLFYEFEKIRQDAENNCEKISKSIENKIVR